MSLVNINGKTLFLKSTDMSIETHTSLKFVTKVEYNSNDSKLMVTSVDGSVIVMQVSNSDLYHSILLAITKL